MLYANDFLDRLETGLRTNLPAWGLPEDAPLRLLTISENATWLVEGPELVVFRVHRPGYHDRDEILSELAWIAALRDEDAVPVPRPLPGLDGSLLQTFHDGEALRHAVCFEHVPGAEPDADADLPRWFHHLGGITARLHGHARRFTLPKGFRRKHWTWETIIGPRAWWGDWRAAKGLGEDDRHLLERTDAALRLATRAHGMGPDRFGLIHGDMRTANLLVQGDRMVVIDFDDCGFGWHGYDFAAAISFIEDSPLIPELMRSWVAGYRDVAPLDPGIEAALPMFVMLRRMQLTAWLASHAETPTALALPGYTAGTVDLARRWLGG
ncbi:phosphotransferase enzyme family protein [Paenirhodobacter sp.]|uniref:phosphotransferase enzyme family protein n=1 Tax=Paenirhodobacter sp. TaxID=1965326 RepID=UPI003B3C5F84